MRRLICWLCGHKPALLIGGHGYHRANRRSDYCERCGRRIA